MPISTRSLASLNNFGVPVGNGVQVGLQPKPPYRFRVLFFNIGSAPGAAAGFMELTRAVQRVSRPQINYPAVAVSTYNSTAYFAGRHEWQPIQLSIRDDVCSTAIMTITRMHYMQIDHLTQSGAMAASVYKFHMGIEYLDGGNPGAVVLESWELLNCFITDVNYNDLDYERGDGFLTIDLTIRYDNAVLVAGGKTATPLGQTSLDCGLVRNLPYSP